MDAATNKLANQIKIINKNPFTTLKNIDKKQQKDEVVPNNMEYMEAFRLLEIMEEAGTISWEPSANPDSLSHNDMRRRMIPRIIVGKHTAGHPDNEIPARNLAIYRDIQDKLNKARKSGNSDDNKAEPTKYPPLKHPKAAVGASRDENFEKLREFYRMFKSEDDERDRRREERDDSG